jgi:hypothetical protein
MVVHVPMKLTQPWTKTSPTSKRRGQKERYCLRFLDLYWQLLYHGAELPHNGV